MTKREMAVDIIIEMSRDHVIKPSRNRSIRTMVTRPKLLLHSSIHMSR